MTPPPATLPLPQVRAADSSRREEPSSSRSPVRVCHVSMTLKTGGLERLLVEFGKFHDSSRYDLRFVALADLGPPAEDLRQLGFMVSSLRFGTVGKLSVLRRLVSILRDEKVDIVHTHNTYAHF